MASNQVCASLISMCALTDNGCFAWLVMMFFFWVLLVVSVHFMNESSCVKDLQTEFALTRECLGVSRQTTDCECMVAKILEDGSADKIFGDVGHAQTPPNRLIK